MTFTPTSADRLLSIYLALGQYPILSSRIRARMRRELFENNIVLPQNFEAEVREGALRSQEREGLRNPFNDEPAELWDMRMSHIRDQLTDLSFSEHFSFEVFQRLVNEVLKERGISVDQLLLSINPEVAPLELVFEQAMTIDRLPVAERSKLDARLQESKVVLIRHIISDQLRYINIAKDWFTISDLVEIQRHKIGVGKIGGKAAGMMLAFRILNEIADPALKTCLSVPESFFIGSDEMYTYMSINNLVHWNDQKYKTEDQMRLEYPLIVADYVAGEFSPDIQEKLQGVLINVGRKPLIIRSSSLLEDNFGTSFAGKYESIFLPNQGSLAENLKALTQGIAKIYASIFDPYALLYRRGRGLQDYDERMAVLIQVVEGETFGRYFFPDIAGVAFSRNLYRWAPQIRREDGFLRMVWGLGTRAVDRVGNDYPRLVALSHPLLRPSNDHKTMRRYSQQYIDLIDLEENEVKTLPIHEVLTAHYPALRFIAQLDEEGDFISMRSNLIEGDANRLVLTFDDLLRRTPFAEYIRKMLNLLESSYHSPVDLEFAGKVQMDRAGKPELQIALVQCRPQSYMTESAQVPLPESLDPEKVVFLTRFVVPQGYIAQVDYVVFVPPEGYFCLHSEADRHELGQAIGRLNKALTGESFICVGPGRWGSSNTDLGVPIAYGDIYNTRALVELAGEGIGPAPEPSLGTHFFQDLLEAQIFPLAIYLDDKQTIFNHKFFFDTPNRLAERILVDEKLLSTLRLIKVTDYAQDSFVQIVMNDEKSLAVAFFEKDKGERPGLTAVPEARAEHFIKE
ncbi:MAG TPA: PEP/pyruvate-binding domain-containing protein [Anaerolineaceae bacterium]|nr:PEP/pyruvate-binding domain-containing protein [Anaerolineaceae bacterium]